MVQPTRPPKNGFIRALRQVYNPLGFSKGYNAVIAFLALGYIFAFTLARLQYLSFNGVFCNRNIVRGDTAAPGECYYYLQPTYKVGIKLHLYCILPAAFLVVFQFIPIIRYKVILFHRLNGYVIVILSTISSAGAIVVAPHAFGGHLATRTYVGALVISTTLCYVFAYIDIKTLQIDQHRAWMIRAWALFSTTITIRIIMVITAQIVSGFQSAYVGRACAQADWLFGGKEGALYFFPDCKAFYQGDEHEQTLVKANFGPTDGNALEIGAALGIGFGAAGWIAFWLHAIAVEIYLRLTPAESERLREVSYKRQLESGFKNPGSAGLVAERFGDVSKPWAPSSQSESVALHKFSPGDGEDRMRTEQNMS